MFKEIKQIAPCVGLKIEKAAAVVYVYGREDRIYYKGVEFRRVLSDIEEKYVNAGPLMSELNAKKLAHLICRGLNNSCIGS
jgi:hypothetical protein